VRTLSEHFGASKDTLTSEATTDSVVPSEPQNATLVLGGRDLPAKLWLGNRIPAKSRRPKCVAIEGDEGWEVVESSEAPNVPQYFVERLELRFAESTPPRVAVVDDDASLAEGVADYLNMQGMAATAFSNPQEFVNSLERVTWEGVVLDWTLGDWTGQEVMQYISKSSSSAAPLILLTGILNTPSSEEGKVAASALGGRLNATFMSKPIDNARIVAQLRKMIWAHESA
jgi:CheY-like chemotaxis protein